MLVSNFCRGPSSGEKGDRASAQEIDGAPAAEPRAADTQAEFTATWRQSHEVKIADWALRRSPKRRIAGLALVAQMIGLGATDLTPWTGPLRLRVRWLRNTPSRTGP